MRKTLLYLVALTILIGCNTGVNKTCIITGTVSNLQGKVIKLRIDWQVDTISFNNDGTFRKEININKPTDAKLMGQGLYNKLYLEPGKNLIMNFDRDDFINTVKFDGELSIANEFIKQLALMDAQDSKARSKYNGPPFKAKDLLPFIDSLKSARLAYLKNYCDSTKGFSKVFYNRMVNAIEYSYLWDRYSYPRRLWGPIKEQMEVSDTWFSFLKDVDLTDDSNLDVFEVEDFYNYYTSLEVAKRAKMDPNYIGLHSEWVPEAFKFVKEKFPGNKFYDYILHYILWSCIENNENGTAGIEDLVDEYLTRSTDSSKVTHIRSLVKKWSPIAKGQPARAFTLMDDQGKMVSLADYRGKYVFIDFWFNGCGSCLTNFPALKEVISGFQNRNIVFISISVEKERSDWLKMLDQGADGFQFDKMSNWVQLHDPRPSSVARDYFVTAYPTYILIGPDGNYVNSRCGWPKVINLEALLNKLPGL